MRSIYRKTSWSKIFCRGSWTQKCTGLFWWIDLKFPKNMQQAPMGTSFLILGDRLVRLLQNIRISCLRTITKRGGARVSQLFKTVEFVNLRKVASIMIIIETNNVLRKQKMMAKDEGKRGQKMILKVPENSICPTYKKVNKFFECFFESPIPPSLPPSRKSYFCNWAG